MTLRHMRIFICVYERKNITGAANALHMTQPAVSRAIIEIESHYKAQLFIRLQNGVTPTNRGMWFYNQFKQLIDSYDNMENMAADMLNHNLRINCCAMLGQFYMPLCISRFNKLYPQISTKVTISRNCENILTQMKHKLFDIAILDTEIKSNSFIVKKLFDYHLVPIFPAHDPLIKKDHLRIEEMESGHFICTEKGRPLRIYMEAVFSTHGMQFEPQWECVSTQGILNAVSQGHGISFLPLGAIKDALREGLVATRSIDNEAFLRNINIVYPKEYIGAEIKTFLQFIISDSKQFKEDWFS